MLTNITIILDFPKCCCTRELRMYICRYYRISRNLLQYYIYNFFKLCVDKFNTAVDIKLREWAESELPLASIRAGREALREEFSELMRRGHDSDPVYEPVKREAVDEALRRHQWEDRAQDVSYANTARWYYGKMKSGFCPIRPFFKFVRLSRCDGYTHSLFR